MHEVSLGYTIKDYLSGRDIEATTYEDIRQAIAKMIVERKGYPQENLRSKVPISFEIDGRLYTKSLDLVAYSNQSNPLLVIMFCAGDVETYIRQTLAAGRLHPGQPARLATVTDTTKALLLCTANGNILERTDYESIPAWSELNELVKRCPAYYRNEKKRKVEQRIFYAFSELTCGCERDECDT